MDAQRGAARHMDTPEDLMLGFFERPSTTHYIRELAASTDVTIVAGAGVSADIGAPLWSGLAHSLLNLVATASPELSGQTSDAEAAAVVEAMLREYPAPYIASCIREELELSYPSNHEEMLRDYIQTAVNAGRTHGGFLARSVCLLAFTARARSRNIQVITTNFDQEIANSAEHVRNYYPDLQDIRFIPALEEVGSNDVRLVHLNGTIPHAGRPHLDGRLVLGEADFFEVPTTTDEPDGRVETVRDALAHSTTLFVGSSITDPDMVGHLASTPRGPRYAVMTAPELGLSGSAQRLARRLAANRFQHLGIVPIQVDFRHQVPQFLREVALCCLQGESYVPYMKRLETWWSYWSQYIGIAVVERDLDKMRQDHDVLRRVRDVVADYVSEQNRHETQGHELFGVELWLRDHKQRELVLWSSSEGTWHRGRSAHRAPLSLGNDDHYWAQKAFREGRPITNEFMGSRGPWRYFCSIPVVLHKAPWLHLPVGVVNILSSDASGALAYSTRNFETMETLDNIVLEPIREVADCALELGLA